MLGTGQVLAVTLASALVLSTPVEGPAPTVRLAETPSASATFNGAVNVVVYRGRTIYVGGSFTRARDVDGTTHRRLRLAAVDARTGRVLPWRPSADRAVHSLAVTARHVYVGGSFTRVNNRPHRRLAKVVRARAGRVLRTPPGFAANGPVYALAVGRGRLYAGGAFTSAGGRARSRLAAFTLRRAGLVRGWAPTANAGVRALRVTRTRVYVAGGFSVLGGRRQAGRLAALTPTDGRLVRAFRPPI